MNKSLLSAFVLAALSASALAQPAPQPALDAFLEQRAAEELASEGTILSRLGVALDVEIVEGKATISLVDIASRRPVASTKLESLPTDRDAAVAAVTVVSANLAAQLDHSDSSAAAVRTMLQDERSERAARDQAQWRYNREAITFSKTFVPTSHGSREVFQSYQGDRPLDGTGLLLALGRKDLADDVSQRKTIVRVGIFGGSLALIAGGGIGLGSWGAGSETGKIVGGALMAGGVIGIVVGVYKMFSLPFDENDLYDMADDHNTELRKKYGLPVAAQSAPHAAKRSVAIAPYVDRDGGGFAVAGRF